MNETPNSAEDTDPAASEPLDWREYYHAIYDRLWIVILCTVLGAVGAAFKLTMEETMYRARTVLFIEQDKDRILGSKVESVRDDQIRTIDMINTLVDTLGGYPLALKVSETLKLNTDPAFIAAAKLKDKEKEKDLTPADAAGILMGMVRPAYRKNTRLIDIIATTRDPALSTKLANAYANGYLRMTFEQATETTRAAGQFLVDEAARLGKKMRLSEEAMQSFRERERAASLETMQAEAQAKLNDITEGVTQLQRAITQIDTDLIAAQGIKDSPARLLQLPSIAAEPQLAQLSANIEAQEKEVDLLAQRYLPDHPLFSAASKRLELTKKERDELLSKILDLLQARRDKFQAQLVQLTAAQKDSEQNLLTITSKSVEYNSLTRELATDRALYEAVLNRLKEVDVTKGLTNQSVSIHEQATGAGIVPISYVKIAAIGIGLGLAAGIAIAIGLFKLDSSIKTVDQAEWTTGLTVVAAVPKMTRADRRLGSLVTNEDRSGLAAEAFRSLRASIAMQPHGDLKRSFLFTSAMPGEGKTFSSSNFAITLAQKGYKTIYIDGDLRKPGASKVFFGENRKPGLSEVLLGTCALKDVVIQTQVEGLSIVTAGGRSPNPAELFDKESLKAVMQEALSTYDRVVVDTAPLLAVSDTLLIAPHVDVTCIVVRAFGHPRKMVVRAVDALKSIGRCPAGIVLNHLPTGRGSYYAYYYSGKYYGSYGSKGVYGS